MECKTIKRVKALVNKHPHIERVESLRKDDFPGAFNQPILMVNQATNWHAMGAWTPNYFKNKYGELRVKSYLTSDDSKYRNTTLSEYMDYLNTTKEKDPYYLKNWTFHNDCPELLSDIIVPECFNNWLDRTDGAIRMNWLYIGPKYTGSPLHTDIYGTSAWNAVFSGRKIWIFYPPDQIGLLYNLSANTIKPNLKKHPQFKNARPFICVQNPGDIVYTPSNWPHQVFNIEATIAITQNFINESNIEHVKVAVNNNFNSANVKAMLLPSIPELA